MRKVTLVYLPGSNYLIGTFDASLTTGWWISSGFAGAETIIKGFQSIGSIHLAICKMLDGTWSIFKSSDYAQSWTEVFNIPYEIYDAVNILPGRTIINTSNGFYETTDSGLTWTLILGLPSAPIASSIANIGGGDILVCTDGRYIWRSTNLARSWIRVCDQAALSYRRAHWSSSGNVLYDWFAWQGTPRHPAIAGANGYVLCAYGPFMSFSNDGGITWGTHEFWDAYVDYPGFADVDGGEVFPSKSIIYDRFPLKSTSSANFLIKQILVSGVDGPTAPDVSFVIRVVDLTPMSGQSTLYSRVFYGKFGWFRHNIINQTSIDPWPKMKLAFTQTVSPDENSNKLCSYELPISGNSDFMDRVVVSAQSKIDNYGILRPTLSVSDDGGETWTKLDITTITFELPTDNGDCIFDDNFAKLVWTWGACTNVGSWNYTKNHWRRMQSYDMDWILQPYETMKSPYNMRVKIEPPAIISIKYDMGLFALGRHLVSMRHDSLIEVTNEKPYLNTLIIEQGHSTSYDIDEITEVGRTMPYDMIIWLEKTSHKPYVMSYHTEVSSSTTYAMTAWFGQVTVPDIDWASPQWWNLIFPDSNRPPLDSRGVY